MRNGGGALFAIIFHPPNSGGKHSKDLEGEELEMIKKTQHFPNQDSRAEGGKKRIMR